MSAETLQQSVNSEYSKHLRSHAVHDFIHSAEWFR